MTRPPVPATPPRFVPTLTEVVALDASVPLVYEPVDLTKADAAPVPNSDEELTLRVLQRVESDLQRRLGALIERVVQKQTATLAQGLAQAIEPMVRLSVTEAVAAELQRDLPAPSPSDPRISP